MFFHCLVSWAWLDWPLTDHYLSVLRRCWLGHMTCKIVPEKTYNVSSGMLSPTTIPSAVYWSVNQRINQSVNPAPPIRCLCIDFVHVTNCIYDYEFYDYDRCDDGLPCGRLHRIQWYAHMSTVLTKTISLGLGSVFLPFLPRDATHKCGLCSHAVFLRPSVRPSVTFIYSVKN